MVSTLSGLLFAPVHCGLSDFLARIFSQGGRGSFSTGEQAACRPWPGWRTPSLTVLDVRSPSEFRQGHIPGAISFPLFNDEERASVGILYKNRGRGHAVLHGLGCVGPRLEGMARRLLELAGAGRELGLYCSRGGMRSGSVAWLCSTVGIGAHVLEGGYKRFRRHVLEHLAKEYPLLVLGGRTGSGKTEILLRMAESGAQVLDLEGMAKHRGSAFGAWPDSPQPSCEHFENRLAVALAGYDAALPIWVEDESENLGNVNLPRFFFRQIRNAPVVVVNTEQKARLERVLREYGGIAQEHMATSLDRIRKRLGGAEHKKGRACIEHGDLAGLASILLAYYDKAYEKQLLDRVVLGSVDACRVEEAAMKLLLVKR